MDRSVSLISRSYARCNLCVNHTDHYHHTCEDGTYFCFPLVNNYTVGYQNVSHGQSETRWNECTSKTSTWECQLLKLPWKMTSDHPGAWYSTQREGMCSDAPAPAPSNSTCLGVFPTIVRCLSSARRDNQRLLYKIGIKSLSNCERGSHDLMRMLTVLCLLLCHCIALASWS